MNDKTKATPITWMHLVVIWSIIVFGFILCFILGPGLFPFSVAMAGVAIGFLFFNRASRITQVSKQEWPVRIIGSIGVVNFIVFLYSELIVGNYALVLPFLAIEMGCLGLISALSARKTVTTDQQQNDQKQLDTSKADPFYAEQLKPDKVKEQR